MALIEVIEPMPEGTQLPPGCGLYHGWQVQSTNFCMNSNCLRCSHCTECKTTSMKTQSCVVALTPESPVLVMVCHHCFPVPAAQQRGSNKTGCKSLKPEQTFEHKCCQSWVCSLVHILSHAFTEGEQTDKEKTVCIQMSWQGINKLCHSPLMNNGCFFLPGRFKSFITILNSTVINLIMTHPFHFDI